MSQPRMYGIEESGYFIVCTFLLINQLILMLLHHKKYVNEKRKLLGDEKTLKKISGY
jgi:hypothetical protein